MHNVYFCSWTFMLLDHFSTVLHTLGLCNQNSCQWADPLTITLVALLRSAVNSMNRVLSNIGIKDKVNPCVHLSNIFSYNLYIFSVKLLTTAIMNL